jgi:hypothetical protein
VRSLAQGAREERFLLLPVAEVRQVLFKLDAREPELAQDGLEQAPVDSVSVGVVREASGEAGCVLWDIGDDEPAAKPQRPLVRNRLAAQKL